MQLLSFLNSRLQIPELVLHKFLVTLLTGIIATCEEFIVEEGFKEKEEKGKRICC